MNAWKRPVVKTLAAIGLYPHQVLTRSAFKMYEYRELLDGVPFSRSDRVLDIGCGRGLQTMLLATKAGTVVGIDVAEKDVNAARRNASYLNGRIHCEFQTVRLEHANIPDASFDKVFSFSVIEHIDNYDEVLRQAYRILKPNGWLIFSTDALETIDPEFRQQHQKQYYVERYFTRADLQATLLQLGFRSVTVYPIFRSDYSKNLFMRNIRIPYKFRIVRPVTQYLRLRLAEAAVRNREKGIFLIAKAQK